MLLGELSLLAIEFFHEHVHGMRNDQKRDTKFICMDIKFVTYLHEKAAAKSDKWSQIRCTLF